MKLKTKLIATIVSMCAAIAVMAVGVWASTSQNFTVTIKNDVDVKILSVSADVYGEYATYTQFTGQLEANQTPTYAQKYTRATYADHKDVGYLLYAKEIGRNDGEVGTASGATDYTRTKNAYGYNMYLNETKDDVLFATSNGTLVNTNEEEGANRKDAQWYKDNYNIDFTTHTAQIAYMYTIRQWGKSSAEGATNKMFLNVATERSTDATTKLTAAGSDAMIQTNVFIADATGFGAETNDTWYDISAEAARKVVIPDSLEAKTYYVVILYTFARNSSNLDLSQLSDAFSHTFTLEAEVETEGDYTNYGAAGTTTGLFGVTERNAGSAYSVNATALKPSFVPDQVLADGTDGTNETDRTKEVIASHLPNGYICSGSKTGSDFTPATTWDFVKTLNEGKKVGA